MERSQRCLKPDRSDNMTDGDDDQEQSADSGQKITRSVVNKHWTDCEKKRKGASSVHIWIAALERHVDTTQGHYDVRTGGTRQIGSRNMYAKSMPYQWVPDGEKACQAGAYH